MKLAKDHQLHKSPPPPSLRKYTYGLPKIEPEKVGMSTERLARITPKMKCFIDKDLAPGILTAIVRHGKIVHFETQGFADKEIKYPLKPDTIFRLYSMTKPITAVATMMLYEEGHFLLDEPIANYLPEFRNMKIYKETGAIDSKQPITIKQLLTHTSGLDYGFYPDDPVACLFRESGLNEADARTSGLSTTEYVKKIATLPLYAEPGTVWRYSEAMTVLGRLIELISGTSYSDFLKERLFSPLGMVDTGFFVPEEKLHRLAKLYELGSQGQLVATETLPAGDYSERSVQGSDYSKQPTFESGGSGLVGTATDYLRFAQTLLNGGELEGVRILSPTTVKLIMSNHLGTEYGETPLANLKIPFISRRSIGFGFCGFVVTDAIIGGTGGSDGEYSWGGAASTDFWIDPVQNLIGLVFTQVIPNGNYLSTRARMHQMTYQAIGTS